MGDTDWTQEIVCPLCGYQRSDSWEVLGDGECEVIECPECDEKHFVSRHVEVSYCTRPAVPCEYLDDHGMNCAWEVGDKRPNPDEWCPKCAYQEHRHAEAIALIRTPTREDT